MAYAYGYGPWSLISDSRQHVQCIIGQDPRVVFIDQAMPSILVSFILKEPQIHCATFPSVMEDDCGNGLTVATGVGLNENILANACLASPSFCKLNASTVIDSHRDVRTVLNVQQPECRRIGLQV